MATTNCTIRDDGRYTVVVGWDDELETFFGRVFSRFSQNGKPICEIGTQRGEIRALSGLSDAVMGYASLDAKTVSALRHAASPATDPGGQGEIDGAVARRPASAPSAQRLPLEDAVSV